METKRFFQFEIIKNGVDSSFLFIWIPMLWVYGHYKYFNFFSAWTAFKRHNLTSADIRFWRVKTVPALKGYQQYSCSHDLWEKCYLSAGYVTATLTKPDAICNLLCAGYYIFTHMSRSLIQIKRAASDCNIHTLTYISVWHVVAVASYCNIHKPVTCGSRSLLL